MKKFSNDMLNGISPDEEKRMGLSGKKCVPCRIDLPPMDKEQIDKHIRKVRNWKVIDSRRITKSFEFKSFHDAIEFVNMVAEKAEEEDHHPNICIDYRNVDVSLWTHKINGLHENDFIMAAKIDDIYRMEA